MEYFQISQSDEINNPPGLKNVFFTIKKEIINMENIDELPNPLIFNVSGNAQSQYPDLIDCDLFLVSRSFRNVFRIYDPNLNFIPIALSDSKNHKYETYHMPVFNEIECLSDKSEFNRDKSVIKSMILKEESIENHPIFRVRYSVRPIVIS